MICIELRHICWLNVCIVRDHIEVVFHLNLIDECIMFIVCVSSLDFVVILDGSFGI